MHRGYDAPVIANHSPSSRAPLYVGLDVGTTSVKGAIVDATGRLRAIASVPYAVSRPRPGWVEQDPRDYVDASIRVIRELLACPGIDARNVAALCGSGQAPTHVLLDAGGNPVRPAILWQDTRAAAESGALAREVAPEKMANLIGMNWPVDASNPLARGRWLGTHEPESLARAAHLLSPKDYVHYALTGIMRTDAWSAKGLVHQRTHRVVADIEELGGGLPARIIPPAGTPSDVVGHVTAEASRTTGLPFGIPVTCGWTDGMVAMLGTGSLGHPGLAGDVSGTSEVTGVTLASEPAVIGRLMAARVVDTHHWILYGPTQASGASLGWVMRTVMLPGEPVAPESRQAVALALASTVAPGADGLAFLPYLEGERAPIWNPRARGAFTGLSTATEPGHLIRAVLEGVACSVRHILSLAVETGGTPISEVRVAGGGARVSLWNQIKADVTGLPFRPCETSENGVLGSAILAATGAGHFTDLVAASDAMVRLGEPVVPSPEHRDVYDDLFRRYVALYPAINAVTSPN
jgi:xylulokinase